MGDAGHDLNNKSENSRSNVNCKPLLIFRPGNVKSILFKRV